MAAPSSEGNLAAPMRHPLSWLDLDYYHEKSLFDEMERVFACEKSRNGLLWQ